MSAAKIPCIRARMRQQEILTLRLVGPVPVVIRRVDRLTPISRPISQSKAGRHAVRVSGVLLRSQRSQPVPRGLWQRASHLMQHLAYRLAHLDTPGVTF